jgi:asparagine synthase (glutamine-hydrolysing)
MCGIAGATGVASPELVAAMSDALAHRGPDDHGVFHDAASGIALGHRRLSIIDTSSAGHQPMSYADGRYQLIFNGEIYNFADVRRELEPLGHRFVSRSDTEVVLAAYAQWGDASVARLRGMFAFAIYDRVTTDLFLARDRMGIKPLYYVARNGTFAFASELRAFLGTGLVEARLDGEALWDFLALGSFPQPRTAIRGVTSLAPGHTMRVRRDGTFETTKYWDLAEASRKWDLRGIEAAEASRRLRELLEEATRLHMIADVPVGAFLSGGIDSTAVVGLMSRAGGSRIRTFSVGFADDDTVVDERQWARLAAERFDCEHSEVVVSGSEVAAQFDDLVAAIGQPSLDGTNTYLVSKAAGASLKVTLSGLGGDELFAGYPHFRAFARAARLGRASRLLRAVPGRFLRDRDFLASSPAERYATLRLLSDEVTRARIAAHPMQTRLASLYEPLLRRELDPVAQTSYVEVRRYLTDTLLRDADAMAMRWSLEVRPVLLDHVLAEFAFALPAALKLNDRGNKPVLVDAVRDLLPPELLTRKKTGFELPLQSWLIGPLRDRALDAFSSDAARSVFAEPFLAATRAELHSRRRPALRIWAYLVLIEWMRKYGVAP